MKILFVCTANICRSVMAEAIMRDLLLHTDHAKSINVDSAGVEALVGAAPDELTQKICNDHHLDVRPHRACQLTAEMIDNADLVLCLGENNKRLILGAYPGFKEKVSLLKEFRQAGTVRNLSIRDPVGKSLRHYSAGFKEIENEVTRIAPLILGEKS